MNWKYILIVIILAAVVGGGILAWQYLWIPKEEAKMTEVKPPAEVLIDETANWKTYRNEKYGFEVKYPPDWYLNFEEPNVEFATVARSEYLHGVGLPGQGNAWIIFIQRDKRGIDVEKLEQLYKDIYIVQTSVFKEHNRLIYEIIAGFYQGDPKEKSYRGIFNQILSTFRFLE